MSSLPRSNDLGSSRVTDVGSKIDQIIFDSYVTSTDIILKGRNGHVHPKRSEKSAHIESFTSNSDFCTQALSSWKQDVSVPLYIDLSLVLSKSKKILIERWKFCYQRVNDTSKPVKAKLFQKRIVTFLRTLYSFIRLLPGYQVLKLLPHAPNLVFEILDSEDPPIAPSQLASEVWKMYDFPSMGTPRGLLAVAVCYVETSVLQKVLDVKEDVSGFSAVTLAPEAHRSGLSAVSTPIAIRRQTDSHRGESFHSDPRLRQPSISPAFSSGSRGFASSPLDSRPGMRPRSFSSDERYHSHSSGKAVVWGQSKIDSEGSRVATTQRRLSLDSRLQQSSTAAAALGEVLNVDNIFNMLQLGDKPNPAALTGGFGYKKHSSVSSSPQNSDGNEDTPAALRLTDDGIRNTDIIKRSEVEKPGEPSENSAPGPSSTMEDRADKYHHSETLVPRFTQERDSSNAFAGERALPPSPFLGLVGRCEKRSGGYASVSNASHNTVTVKPSDGTGLRQFLDALRQGEDPSSKAFMGPQVSTFVHAIAHSDIALSSKSALGDSTELAFPFGDEADLIGDGATGASTSGDTTRLSQKYSSISQITSQTQRPWSEPFAPQIETNSHSALDRAINTAQTTSSQAEDIAASGPELAVAPQIESFVRHVEALTLAVTASSMRSSSQDESSSDLLTRQLHEFRQFRTTLS